MQQEREYWYYGSEQVDGNSTVNLQCVTLATSVKLYEPRTRFACGMSSMAAREPQEGRIWRSENKITGLFFSYLTIQRLAKSWRLYIKL